MITTYPDEDLRRKAGRVHITVSQRPEGRWRRIVWDLTAPAPESDWARSVTDTRVLFLDQVRPYVTRSLLVVLVAVALAALPGTSVLAWLALVPAVVQACLEIALEGVVRARRERADQPWPLRPLVRLWYRNYERLQINVTGVLGAFAVAVLVLGVAFGAGRSGPGWVRVAAFACTLAYLSSAVLGPLLEATVYSPLQRTPAWLRTARPLLWVVLVAGSAGVVAVSDRVAGAWPPGSVAYAYLACLLPWAVGQRIREYERAMDAAGSVAATARAEANRRVSHELHELLQINKGPLRAAMGAPGLATSDRLSLELFAANISLMYDRARSRDVDMQAGVLPPVRDLVRHLCAAELVRPTVDVELDGLDPTNATLARVLISTLANNAVQAYAAAPELEERTLGVRARVRDGVVDITVTDLLAPIPDRTWSRGGTTLDHLRADLGRVGGVLEQRPLDVGKAVHARWPVTLPSLREPAPSASTDAVTATGDSSATAADAREQR